MLQAVPFVDVVLRYTVPGFSAGYASFAPAFIVAGVALQAAAVVLLLLVIWMRRRLAAPVTERAAAAAGAAS